jgi:hypothetical protein
MAALFKYFVGIAAILAAVLILSAVSMSEIFVTLAAIGHSPAIETPRWNIEHPKAEPDTRYVAHGSLSPIYPATPGKELLSKPVYTAIRVRNKSREPVSAKRIDVRQALQLHKVPRQIYAAGEQDGNYPQQSLSYAQTQPSQPRKLVIFGHGIY